MRRIPTWVPEPIGRRIKMVAHRGDRYTCPFCGHRSRDLQVAGIDLPVLTARHVVSGGVRPSSCWRCGSSDRERLLLLYLRDVRHAFADAGAKHVLHIAPEPLLSGALQEAGFGAYVRGDLFAESYAYAAGVQAMDVTALEAPDATYDLVLCNHVLEHIVTDDVAMRELRRVLKPDGFAVLQVPISGNTAVTFEDPSVTAPKDRERMFGQFDHVRIYGQDYPDRLRAAGFTVERVAPDPALLPYGVNPEEDLFVCTR